MAQRDYKAFLEKSLTRFLLEDDPIKAMLEWLLAELMKVEAEAKVGAPKGKHSRERHPGGDKEGMVRVLLAKM
jgi:hypothetical protein